MHKDTNANVFQPQLKKCPICGSSEIKPWGKKVKNGIMFNIWKCDSCKSGFLNPRPIREWLLRIYSKSGHGLTKEVSLGQILIEEKEYPNAIRDAKRIIKTSKIYIEKEKRNPLRALDIGSGYGFFSAESLQAGFDVTSVNPSVWENKVFKELNGFYPIQSFFEDLEFDKNEFDLVIMSQVLEHLQSPTKTLLKVNEILVPNGILTIAVPNFDSILVKLLKTKDNSCLWVPEHLNYFSLEGLNKILVRTGFEIVQYQPISRIPYFIVSNKLSLMGCLRRVCNQTVKIGQIGAMSLVNSIGYGMYYNVWAKRI
jgi:SAM-dependent methyltransferase